MKQVTLLIPFLVMLLSVLASGEIETIETGDYVISFDLGLPKDAYTVVVANPEQTENLSGDQQTTYTVGLQNKTSVANESALDVLIINLIKNEKEFPSIPTASEMEMELHSSKHELPGVNLNTLETATRKVDGTEGVVASSDFDLDAFALLGLDLKSAINRKYYALVYVPPIDKYHLVLAAESTYPWDNTLKLFKTIHVGKQK